MRDGCDDTGTGNVGNRHDSIGTADPVITLLPGQDWADIVTGSKAGMTDKRFIFASRKTWPKIT
jgi:hypothetical protein